MFEWDRHLMEWDSPSCTSTMGLIVYICFFLQAGGPGQPEGCWTAVCLPEEERVGDRLAQGPLKEDDDRDNEESRASEQKTSSVKDRGRDSLGLSLQEGGTPSGRCVPGEVMEEDKKKEKEKEKEKEKNKTRLALSSLLTFETPKGRWWGGRLKVSESLSFLALWIVAGHCCCRSKHRVWLCISDGQLSMNVLYTAHPWFNCHNTGMFYRNIIPLRITITLKIILAFYTMATFLMYSLYWLWQHFKWL